MGWFRFLTHQRVQPVAEKLRREVVAKSGAPIGGEVFLSVLEEGRRKRLRYLEAAPVRCKAGKEKRAQPLPAGALKGAGRNAYPTYQNSSGTWKLRTEFIFMSETMTVWFFVSSAIPKGLTSTSPGPAKVQRGGTLPSSSWMFQTPT